MAVEPPSRFDYLFEPIGGDEGDVAPDAAVVTAPPVPGPRPRSLPVVAVSILFGAAVGAVVLWPKPVSAGEIPAAVTAPVSASAVPVSIPAMPPPQAPTPPPELPPALPVMAASNLATTPRPAPEPVVTAPSTNTSPPSPPPRTSLRTTPTPTVRLPLSVSPQPRSAPENHAPGNGDGARRGLLGGGLPGPL